MLVVEYITYVQDLASNNEVQARLAHFIVRAISTCDNCAHSKHSMTATTVLVRATVSRGLSSARRNEETKYLHLFNSDSITDSFIKMRGFKK